MKLHKANQMPIRNEHWLAQINDLKYIYFLFVLFHRDDGKVKKSRVLSSDTIVQDHKNGQKVPRVTPFRTMIEQGES